MKLILICIVVLLLSQNTTMANDMKQSRNKIKSKVILLIGMPVATSSNDFFNNYSKYLDGNEKEFRSSTIFAFDTKIDLIENFKLGLSLDYLFSKLNEGYRQRVNEGNITGNRDIVQNFTVTSMPLMLSIEYVPFRIPYYSYTGIGLGACFSNIKWDEQVISTIERDKRIGGNHYLESIISPAIRLYSGVELHFDKTSDEIMLSGLILEARFTYIFRSATVFRSISEQMYSVPKNWDKPFTILPNYIGLYIGVSFNFSQV